MIVIYVANGFIKEEGFVGEARNTKKGDERGEFALSATQARNYDI